MAGTVLARGHAAGASRGGVVLLQAASSPHPMLMDIGTEELSHLEVVGMLSRMHLLPMKYAREAAEADPLVAIAGGGGVTLCNSMGNPWTADYLKVTGELDVDLRSKEIHQSVKNPWSTAAISGKSR